MGVVGRKEVMDDGHGDGREGRTDAAGEVAAAAGKDCRPPTGRWRELCETMMVRIRRARLGI